MIYVRIGKRYYKHVAAEGIHKHLKWTRAARSDLRKFNLFFGSYKIAFKSAINPVSSAKPSKTNQTKTGVLLLSSLFIARRDSATFGP